MAILEELKHVFSNFGGSENLIFAGFGNTLNDAYSYLKSGIISKRVFTVNEQSQVLVGFNCRRLMNYEELSKRVTEFFPEFEQDKEEYWSKEEVGLVV